MKVVANENPQSELKEIKKIANQLDVRENDLLSFLKKYRLSKPQGFNVKFPNKIRKSRIDTLWKDCCITLYGHVRLHECMRIPVIAVGNLLDALMKINELGMALPKGKWQGSNLQLAFIELITLMIRLIQVSVPNDKEIKYSNIKDAKKVHEIALKKKLKLTIRKEFNLKDYVKKIGNKSYLVIDMSPKCLKTLKSLDIKVNTSYKFLSKSEIIKKIVNHDSFWQNRKDIKNLPIEEKNIKNIFWKEEIAFKKVIKKIKEKKYNLNYFKNTKLKPFKDLWAWEKSWNLFLEVR